MNYPIACVSMVLISEDYKILLGRRKKEPGAGLYAPPGGKIEKYETYKDAIDRELYEETGCILDCNPILLTQFEDVDKKNQMHYFGNFYLITKWKNEPKNTEPDKCEGWYWFSQNKFNKMPVTRPTKGLRTSQMKWRIFCWKLGN